MAWYGFSLQVPHTSSTGDMEFLLNIDLNLEILNERGPGGGARPLRGSPKGLLLEFTTKSQLEAAGAQQTVRQPYHIADEGFREYCLQHFDPAPDPAL